ncbi:hypothetical protein THOM_1752 [Trachipleistophora hominis]|uniref:Uncharacterized protein n=1 Tax=Trachipleistophora hominis TaxID=72359 RepID=L7JV60_TRAHO|nr:hypothetical protein THOM_1752 [Trachipleistophora hominis]
MGCKTFPRHNPRSFTSMFHYLALYASEELHKRPFSENFTVLCMKEINKLIFSTKIFIGLNYMHSI